ncbi:MAG: alpha amylase C-terminal domain-containing protein, partial [Acidobacteriota bacterium]|nr:alpha amylase C-terminal domain-containing protein [Acidobacteriota bacterium]
DPAGFEWVDFRDSRQSILAFLRRASNGETVLAAFNFTPVPRHGYRLGVPLAGRWEEIANGDAAVYGGSGLSSGGADAAAIPQHGRPFSVELTLPPLAAVFLKSPPAAVLPSPRAASLAAGTAPPDALRNDRGRAPVSQEAEDPRKPDPAPPSGGKKR